MKKLLYLFAASLLVFTSCSKDDNDSSDPASSILLKQRIDGVSAPANYLYDGNKIISITDADGSVTKYVYTGDVITKKEDFDKNSKLDLTTEYMYTNGKLSVSIEENTGAEFYFKTKYTYNADGTVSYDKFRGNVSTGVEVESGASGKYTFKDGNLVKLEVSNYGSELYEYDTKNNPFKNVTGMSLLLNDETAVNNVIKVTYTSGSGVDISTNITTYTYRYDANNYPTEKVKSYLSGDSLVTYITQFIY